MFKPVRVPNETLEVVENNETVPAVKHKSLKKAIKKTALATTLVGVGVLAVALKKNKSSQQDETDVNDDREIIATVETA